MNTTATYSNKSGPLRDLILDIEYNGKKLFCKVEQGIRQNRNNTYILYYHNNRKDIQYWINKALNLEFIINENQDVQISVEKI